jgi:hypothetical protein
MARDDGPLIIGVVVNGAVAIGGGGEQPGRGDPVAQLVVGDDDLLHPAVPVDADARVGGSLLDADHGRPDVLAGVEIWWQ